MEEQTLQNYRAFTKLYGYIRFFHPSDEAATIDWDKFAVYGFEYVENSANDIELRQKLLELFLPIAPSIEIYISGDDFKYDLKKIIPENTEGLLPVAWQHLGIQTYNDQIYDIYKSVRVNRIPEIKNNSAFLSKRIITDTYSGKKLRVEAGIKFEKEEYEVSCELWIKTFKKNCDQSAENSTEVSFGNWKKYFLEIDIAEDTAEVEFGITLKNEGSLFVNGFAFSVFKNGKWESNEINDGKFQNQQIGNPPVDWNIVNSDYMYEIIDFDTYDNDKACFIQSKYDKLPFEKFPHPGELFNKPITGSIRCIVPLALYSDSTGTIPKNDITSLNKLVDELNREKYSELIADNKYVRLGGIAILWNVIQHSYPYFELYEIDWNKSLDVALLNICGCKNENEYIDYLQLLTAVLNDGHAGVIKNNIKISKYYPPVKIEFVEDKYVVSRILSDGTGFKEGDIITAIDGRDVNEIAEEAGNHVSAASIGWKMYVITRSMLTKGEKDSEIIFEINRNGENFKITSIRNYNYKDFGNAGYYNENRPEKLIDIKPGIIYADLTRLNTEELEEKISYLAESKGVIFDVRGYPRLSPDFLCHLTGQKIYSAKWNVPEIIYPDYENLIGYDTTGRWEMEPLVPQFKGKIVFLTNAGAISYAESVMGIVKAYKLGTIIGEPTAGTNGNVNNLKLPGGYNAVFTGMKVIKHDNTAHHGVGIIPDIPVKRTIKGITEKRDEFLEKALEIIEK